MLSSKIKKEKKGKSFTNHEEGHLSWYGYEREVLDENRIVIKFQLQRE